ncbi:MAG: TetR/AcrR family transcriptional regulator [Solirubrobacteraceae bacterium]|nr:TetR/AcrR family transcriptional regulator [Solirubrobacteraceae bacterium]
MSEGAVPEVRKTRRERQAETRQQVVTAARELFLTRGYHGTTLSAVVEAAGFTKGAVYSNFASKAELALAVVEEIERENVEKLAGAFQGASDPAERAKLLTLWGETILSDTAALRLRAELSFAAMDDPALAETIRHKSRNVRASVAAMLRGIDHSERFQLDVPVLADALTALANGVGMQRLGDPDFDVQAFVLAAGVLTGMPLSGEVPDAS